METRHVRIDYEEALDAKKQLLSSEMNVLNIAKKIKAYRVLRKKELAAKTRLRTALVSLRTKINLINRGVK